jgi:hypothetical protein
MCYVTELYEKLKKQCGYDTLLYKLIVNWYIF